MSHYHAKKLKSNPNNSLRSKQRLYPLFILAFSLVGLGAFTSYQSFTGERGTAMTGLIQAPLVMEAFPLDALSDVLSTEDFPEGLDLYYRAGGLQSFELTMRQQNEYAEAGAAARTLETLFNISWQDRTVVGEGSESLVIERDLGEVRIDVVEQGERVGADITNQLALLLSGVKGRVVMSDRGLVQSQQWISETNAQTLQTLHVIDDAIGLAIPHFLREAVHVGEEWTYRLRTSAEDASQQRLEADGALEVSNRVAGTIEKGDRQYAVITQQITGALRGVFGGSSSYTMSGEGRGLVFFDIESGEILSSQIELERTIRLDENLGVDGTGEVRPQTSRIELYLTRRMDDVQAEID